ncbi:cell division protein FtsL [Lichenibacterium dinghuense]|uniref:cell division protein FtsL n=1 Tax=Lichenibacterium dinghuense TaxID=2895977 RepID=UPI001F1DA2D4|nr:hypothetical protein [Lichenibacterium sp. 6Y81]
MLRILNVLAVAALIGSAVYAYSVKYETILYGEQIIKTRHLIAQEQDGIDKLEAEWAILTRPDRLASLADHGLSLQKLSLDQIVQPADLPDPPPKVDSIGRKLDALGLGEPTATPSGERAAGAAAGGATPSSATPAR